MCYQFRWFVFLCMSICQTNKSQTRNQQSKVSNDIIISKNIKTNLLFYFYYRSIISTKNSFISTETASKLNRTINIDIFNLMIFFCRFGFKIIVLNFDAIPCLNRLIILKLKNNHKLQSSFDLNTLQVIF